MLSKGYNTERSRSGFAYIFLIILSLALGVAVIFGSKALEIYNQKSPQGNGIFTSSKKCSSPLKLASPLKIEDVGFIIPLGRMSDSHVTPTDHQYWTPKNAKSQYQQDFTNLPLIFDVYSPADGVITSVEEHTFIPSEASASQKIDDWRIIINHKCGISTIFIHLDKLSDEVASKVGKKLGEQNGTINYEANIPVKRGQIVAKKAERSFDFSIHDENVTLPGLINPKRYANEPWKIHTVDPLDYFEEPVRSQLLTKVVRKAEPRGGKIDYDVPGKLVGNWFKEGYDPKNTSGRFWDGELTIAYSSLDPSQIFISTGDFNGKSSQFAVLGNSPDPKDVGVGQTVKYELVNFSYVDDQGQAWNEGSYTSEVKLVPANVPQGSVTFKLKDKDILEVTIGSKTQIYNR